MSNIDIRDLLELERIFKKNIDIVKGVTEISVRYLESDINSDLAMDQILKLLLKQELNIDS